MDERFVTQVTHVEDVGTVYALGDAGFRIDVSVAALEVISRALPAGLLYIEDVESKVVSDAVIDPTLANQVAHELLSWEGIKAGKAKADANKEEVETEQKEVKRSSGKKPGNVRPKS